MILPHTLFLYHKYFIEFRIHQRDDSAGSQPRAVDPRFYRAVRFSQRQTQCASDTCLNLYLPCNEIYWYLVETLNKFYSI